MLPAEVSSRCSIASSRDSSWATRASRIRTRWTETASEAARGAGAMLVVRTIAAPPRIRARGGRMLARVHMREWYRGTVGASTVTGRFVVFACFCARTVPVRADRGTCGGAGCCHTSRVLSLELEAAGAKNQWKKSGGSPAGASGAGAPPVGCGGGAGSKAGAMSPARGGSGSGVGVAPSVVRRVGGDSCLAPGQESECASPVALPCGVGGGESSWYGSGAAPANSWRWHAVTSSTPVAMSIGYATRRAVGRGRGGDCASRAMMGQRWTVLHLTPSTRRADGQCVTSIRRPVGGVTSRFDAVTAPSSASAC